MRNLIAKIVAAMRRMGSFTTQLVKRAGRWVAELVHVPAAPMAEAAEVVPDTTPSRQDDFEAIRDLAKVLASGKDAEPALLKGLPPLTVKWLSAMDRSMLCRVIAATDETLSGHMRGRSAIRGVVPYDQTAVDDVTAAKDGPRPRDRGPTLRELLEERAGVSLAA
jgi:hypothetical protein